MSYFYLDEEPNLYEEHSCKFLEELNETTQATRDFIEELYHEKPDFFEIDALFKTLKNDVAEIRGKKNEAQLFKNLEDWITWNNNYLKNYKENYERNQTGL